MPASIELERSSHLAASRGQVWATVSTMRGVNAELGPYVRMTAPPGRGSLADAEVEPGRVLFHSWLLAFGIVPFDRHALVLLRTDEGSGFVEESTSWLQRRWRHERTLVDRGPTACRITDRLVVDPRLGFATPVVAAVVRFLFLHRHRRLVRRFGGHLEP